MIKSGKVKRSVNWSAAKEDFMDTGMLGIKWKRGRRDLERTVFEIQIKEWMCCA